MKLGKKNVHHWLVILITFFIVTFGATFFLLEVTKKPLFDIPEENIPHYLIHTEGCIVSDFDPSHPSIVRYKAKTLRQLNCSNKLPITEESGLSLIFYEERISEYESSKKDVKCSYEGIIREEQNPKKYNGQCDRKWKIKDKIALEKRETTIDEDGIFVTCVDGSKNTTIYKSIHFFIQPRRVKEKRQKFKVKVDEYWKRREKPSIIIMGTDAVSRGNLRRHLPLTFDYLTNHLHVIDLKGFNKVGDNTDPNLTALLMGLSQDELKKHKCLAKHRKRYDNCPFIWKNFSEKGYATAYGEDAPWMGAFHFNKDGFCKEPTDYYNRPYFYASDKLIGNKGGHKGYNGNLCQGGRSSISLIHNYSLAIAENLKDIPYFGFYWTASITHDYLGSATMADQPSLDYLKQLNDGGYLQHTILFFLSDHGLRWGSFRSTYAGMLEDRMPYVMIAFPNWFTEEYPEAMKKLKINTRRLTSTFDIYATLHDILNQAYAHPDQSSPPWQHGQSLFQEVPRSRTCQDAAIPEHYCICEDTKEVDRNDTHLQEAAEKAVEEINKGLKPFPKCAQLTLDKVLYGRVEMARNSTLPKKVKMVATSYLVTYVTQPGGAQMESTVRKYEGKYEVVSEASRINKYGNQSHCVTDAVYRKYCYCKDLLR